MNTFLQVSRCPLAALIGKFMGEAVTTLSLVQKIPQIVSVVKSNGTRGISLPSLALELWCYVTTTCYSIGSSIPFTSYCEYPSLLLQDFFLLMSVLHYRHLLGFSSVSIMILALLFQLCLASGYFPYWAMALIISGSIPITTTSKVLQLVKTIREKNSGDISATTWAIGAFTRGVRFYTFTVEVWNPPLAFNMFISAVLNFAICVTTLLYREKPHNKKIN